MITQGWLTFTKVCIISSAPVVSKMGDDSCLLIGYLNGQLYFASIQKTQKEKRKIAWQISRHLDFELVK